ncbi:MAG TPA: hypothetical protein DCS63_09185 [Elusimicrobia bacterium]|nr:hypothetical protein [Elusimicrobiota bacterium]
MNDNLPDINFKEKEEKKRGVAGWLRGKLGFGSRGAIGEAGMNPSAMNVGRALGTAKFGASAGLGSFLSGNIGAIATVAMVAVASGVYLASNAPSPGASTSAFSSGKVADNYVPAILRSQAANQGSSLDMFKDTNKGALGAEADASSGGKPAGEEAAPAEDPKAQNGDQSAGGQNNMAQEMMAKLQGGGAGSLTSSMGGGSNKFSSMGGFGNKFNQGATGAKTGFSSGIGAGFQAMPKFDARKGKMTAMKASSRPVFSSSKSGKTVKSGVGSLGQAKGLRDTQKTYTGNNIDSARSTQDKAWEGSTAEGGASGGGAGLGDGGAGIVTSPSLDNGSGAGGGGVDDGTGNDPLAPDVSSPMNASPWAGLAQSAMMYIMISAVLSAIGGMLIQAGGPWLTPIGYALCAAAMGLGLMALMAGVQIMTSHGQALLGTVYVVGGGAAMAAAGLAMVGGFASGLALILSAVAGVIGLIGSMLGGK